METSPPRDAEATRAAILDAAESAFAELGFADCALREVATRAGVTKSLIHHHFGSKEGLWQAVLSRRFAEYAALQHGILSRPHLDLADFEDSVGAMFEFLRRNPAFVRLHGWANAGSGAGFVDSGSLTERGVTRLRELQKAGVVRPDVDPAAVLAGFFGLVEHWFQARAGFRHRFGVDLPDDETYLETIRRILIRGVQP